MKPSLPDKYIPVCLNSGSSYPQSWLCRTPCCTALLKGLSFLKTVENNALLPLDEVKTKPCSVTSRDDNFYLEEIFLQSVQQQVPRIIHTGFRVNMRCGMRENLMHHFQVCAELPLTASILTPARVWICEQIDSPVRSVRLPLHEKEPTIGGGRTNQNTCISPLSLLHGKHGCSLLAPFLKQSGGGGSGGGGSRGPWGIGL